MDLLRGRIAASPTADPTSLLAKHEASLIKELRGRLASASSHRDPKIERELLPHCQGLIESIGHRFVLPSIP